MLECIDDLPQIVFCTAYEEYALQAFNTLALDYLVKPVDEERLQLTVQKLEQKKDKGAQLQVQELLDLMRNNEKEKVLHSIPHKIGDRILLIKIEKITYFLAKEKYVEFHINDGKCYLTELSLKKLIERLPDDFKQVQRSIIVNTNHVKEYRKYFRGKYILVLDDVGATKLKSGRSYSESIKDMLSIE